MAQREPAAGGRGAERRLRVLPGDRPGGGVAAVADGEVAAQRRQRLLVEDLADQAEVLEHDHAAAVGHGDAGRLLAAVLQRVEAVVGELRDVLAGRPDPEHAALLAGAVVELGVVLVVRGVCRVFVPGGTQHARSSAATSLPARRSYAREPGKPRPTGPVSRRDTRLRTQPPRPRGRGRVSPEREQVRHLPGRLPEARRAPSASASAHPIRPSASASHVRGRSPRRSAGYPGCAAAPPRTARPRTAARGPRRCGRASNTLNEVTT